MKMPYNPILLQKFYTPPKIKNREMYEPDLPPLKPVEPKKDR